MDRRGNLVAEFGLLSSIVQKTSRLWQHQGAMTRFKPYQQRQHKAPQPLDPQRLTDIAYAYAARYAVTEGRLTRYLTTKVREKGWSGADPATEKIAELAARLVEMGVVNDAAVAQSTVDLARRKGLAGQRVRAALATRQVRGDIAAAAIAQSADTDPEAAALRDARRYAERKRLGPWRKVSPTPERLKKELSALIRAGHGFSVSREVVAGDIPADLDD